MLNILIAIIIIFIAIAIIIEHRINRLHRDSEKKVVFDILQDTKEEFENSVNTELAHTATGQQKVSEMLGQTKNHNQRADKNQSSAENKTISDIPITTEPDDLPLPDPFAQENKTKR